MQNFRHPTFLFATLRLLIFSFFPPYIFLILIWNPQFQFPYNIFTLEYVIFSKYVIFSHWGRYYRKNYFPIVRMYVILLWEFEKRAKNKWPPTVINFRKIFIPLLLFQTPRLLIFGKFSPPYYYSRPLLFLETLEYVADEQTQKHIALKESYLDHIWVILHLFSDSVVKSCPFWVRELQFNRIRD